MKSLSCLLTLALAATATAQTVRWPEEKAAQWNSTQSWLVGANYIPANAINELEMWQADTFSPQVMDKELGWAESIGMNTMRVFLHDLLWQQNSSGFKRRMDQFLQIAQKHHIRPMFVLFDSCWDPFPALGHQRAPKPGIHNSGWVQSPGAKALQDPAQYPRLEAYVKGVVGAFAKDDRILAWDLWNEPDNMNDSSYGKSEPAGKIDLVVKLLPRVFSWARSAGPEQPLTSAIWSGSTAAMERVQLEHSDVISFHNYAGPENFEKEVQRLQSYHRPLLCTEYMARGAHSTFQGILPIAKRYRVAAINWGLVVGKTQTNLPWDSWKKPYIGRQPAVWHHEVFYADGRPYSEEEVQLIRKLTGR